MYVYVVTDDESSVEYVFDETTFRARYKEFILNPPIYNKDYWEKYTNVYKWEINTDKREIVYPEDMN